MPDDNSIPTPIIHSKLMQDYRVETPVAVGNMIVAIQDAQGDVELFAIGNTGAVSNIAPDPESDTGWAQTPLGVSATAIAAGLLADNLRIVFVAYAENDDLAYLVEDTTAQSGWGGLQTAGLPYGAPVYVIARNLPSGLYVAAWWTWGGHYIARVFNWNNGQPGEIAELEIDSFNLEMVEDATNGVGIVAMVTPQIYTAASSQFESRVYWDRGSGASLDGAFWRPSPPPGYYRIGDYAQGNYSPPSGSILCVSSVEDPTLPPEDPGRLLLSPDNFNLVWDDYGNSSGAAHYDCGGLFWPSMDGYVALGGVANQTVQYPKYNPPPGELFVMLNSSVATKGKYGKRIWDDHGSGARLDVTVWQIEDSNGDPTGCFALANNYSSHAPSSPAYYAADGTALPSIVYTQWVAEGYPGTEIGVGADFTGSVFSATGDANGNLQVFIVQDNGFPYYLDQTRSPASLILLGEDTVTDTNGSIFAGLSASQTLELFAVGPNGQFYHCSQTAPGAAAFSALTQIASGVSQIAGAYAADGNPVVFALGTDGSLQRYTQSPASTDWNVETIELATGDLQPYNCYIVDVMLANGDGSAAVNLPVEIWASGPIVASINGLFYQFDQDTPASLTTDGNGQVSITLEASSLRVPMLDMWYEGMPTGSVVSINPTAEIEQVFADITWQDLMNAQTSSGSLLQGEYDNEDTAMFLAQTLNSCMEVAANAEGFSNTIARIRNRKLAPPGRLGPLPSSYQAWTLDFRSGLPVFRLLTPDEAERLNLNPAVNLIDPVGTIGDIYNSVTDGAEELQEITASAVSGGLQVIITLAGQEPFTIIIDQAEQILDVVELVFVRFDVTFQQLVEWLGYIFNNWAEIGQLMGQLRSQVENMFDNLPSSSQLASAKSAVQNYLSGLNGSVAGLISTITGSTFAGTGLSSFGPVPSDPTSWMSYQGESFWTPGTWALEKILDYMPGVSVSYPDFSSNVQDAFAAFENAWTSGMTADVQNAFNVIQTVVQAAVNNPDQFLQQSLASLLQAMDVQNSLDAILGFVSSLVDPAFALIEAIIAEAPALLGWFDQPVPIPFFEQLATFWGGSSPTMLDLACLAIAVPALTLQGMMGATASRDRAAEEVSIQQVASIFAVGFWALMNGALDKYGQAPEGATCWQQITPDLFVAFWLAMGLPDLDDVEQMAFWWMSMGLVIFDAACAFTTGAVSGPTRWKISRFLNPIGIGGNMLHGAALVGLSAGYWAEVDDQSEMIYSQNIIVGVMEIAKVLNVFAPGPATTALVAIDGVCGLAVTGLQIGIVSDDSEVASALKRSGPRKRSAAH